MTGSPSLPAMSIPLLRVSSKVSSTLPGAGHCHCTLVSAGLAGSGLGGSGLAAGGVAPGGVAPGAVVFGAAATGGGAAVSGVPGNGSGLTSTVPDGVTGVTVAVAGGGVTRKDWPGASAALSATPFQRASSRTSTPNDVAMLYSVSPRCTVYTPSFATRAVV